MIQDSNIDIQIKFYLFLILFTGGLSPFLLLILLKKFRRYSKKLGKLLEYQVILVLIVSSLFTIIYSLPYLCCRILSIGIDFPTTFCNFLFSYISYSCTLVAFVLFLVLFLQLYFCQRCIFILEILLVEILTMLTSPKNLKYKSLRRMSLILKDEEKQSILIECQIIWLRKSSCTKYDHFVVFLKTLHHIFIEVWFKACLESLSSFRFKVPKL